MKLSADALEAILASDEAAAARAAGVDISLTLRNMALPIDERLAIATARMKEHHRLRGAAKLVGPIVEE